MEVFFKVKASSLPCKICHILSFTVDIRKTLCTLEDVHQPILLAKFNENLTLPRRADSILGAVTQQTQELNQSLPPLKLSFHSVFVFRYLLSSKDMADFHTLQGKLESPTLRKHTF